MHRKLKNQNIPIGMIESIHFIKINFPLNTIILCIGYPINSLNFTVTRGHFMINSLYGKKNPSK